MKLTMKSLIEDFGYYFKKYGITQKQLKKFYSKDESIEDYAWTLFQKILLEIGDALQKGGINMQDFYKMTGETYRYMAYLLALEKKDSRRIQALQFENEIKYMDLTYSNLLGVEIFSYGCCDECHKYHNKILSVPEALEFAKNTEARCHPRFNKNSRVTLIAKTQENENSLIKVTVSLGK